MSPGGAAAPPITKSLENVCPDADNTLEMDARSFGVKKVDAYRINCINKVRPGRCLGTRGERGRRAGGRGSLAAAGGEEEARGAAGGGGGGDAGANGHKGEARPAADRGWPYHGHTVAARASRRTSRDTQTVLTREPGPAPRLVIVSDTLNL
ncbi:unnamed protein product [Danaus chrysippus]|uniref:(African queen) hypothetical protein n=1 Tax=Danaus chrysippus TaxID=151541 RepID=A0A8J2W3A4_9NEOP|nr:unnamed protein product [Danaus chrysippus]